MAIIILRGVWEARLYCLINVLIAIVLCPTLTSGLKSLNVEVEEDQSFISDNLLITFLLGFIR